jgi:2-polyprenyl-3-methyl-5-hydroxy-6-metoxy-1,4-benzoquinol methylase
MPNPMIVLETLNSYQRTFALKGAIELHLFTHIAEGATTAAALAAKIGAPEKGVRVLSDYLVVAGFLTKSDGNYGLTEDASIFLNEKSPAYIGSIARFLALDSHVDRFKNMAAIVRKGGSLNADSLEEPDHEMWVEFARSMAPTMMMPGGATAEAVAGTGPKKLLDIAASHGIFGILVAQKNPEVEVWAQDWPKVVAFAAENAAKMGVGDRFHTIPGSAFEVDLGSGYDIVLLPNFLHHFDHATNVGLLKKIHAAMKPDGILATLEFVPNEDRVSPPIPAMFAMMMLGSTPSGDAYTFKELDAMYRDAGFGASEMRELTPLPQRLILTKV